MGGLFSSDKPKQAPTPPPTTSYNSPRSSLSSSSSVASPSTAYNYGSSSSAYAYTPNTTTTSQTYAAPSTPNTTTTSQTYASAAAAPTTTPANTTYGSGTAGTATNAAQRNQHPQVHATAKPTNNQKQRGGRGRGRGRGGGGYHNRPITVDSYYHYTTARSARLIENSEKILMAQEHDHYGPGVYFTKWCVENGHTKAEIAKNNFRAGGGAALHNGRCDWVVRVQIPSNKIRSCPNKRDIWRYPDRDLQLCDYQHEVYEVATGNSDIGGYHDGYDYDYY